MWYKLKSRSAVRTNVTNKSPNYLDLSDKGKVLREEVNPQWSTSYHSDYQ